MPRSSSTAVSAVAFLLSVPAALAAASLPPHLRFRSLATERVTVHFHQGLERTSREAAALAGEILARHERRYGVRVPRVHIVLADVVDVPFGETKPLPYPIIKIGVVAPDGRDELGNHDGWLRLVLTHELAHVVHQEQARGLVRLGRKLLGRHPGLFPNALWAASLFPNTLTPRWLFEGLATYEETQGTAFGRGRNPDARMVLRMAALEGDFPAEDRPAVNLDRWPAGQAPYLFGEAFVRHISRWLGEDTLPRLARVRAGQPTLGTDELTAFRVTGTMFHKLWRTWTREALAGFARESQTIRARGLTPSRALTDRGYHQTAPRFSPDGSWIAYTSVVPTRFGAIRLVRPDGTFDRKLTDRNGGTGLSWTPDGRTIVFDEPEVYLLFAARFDLRAVDVATGKERTLTRGLRARDPHVAPDGRRVVFVHQQVGRSNLAVVSLDGSGMRHLTRSEHGTQWSGPRWSPDGAAIVASRWTRGAWLDLVRVNPRSGEVVALTRDRAKDVEPSFTPDGGHVVFRSDRDGVSNLYALRLVDGALLRLTNVLGGAFEPDVSSDGRRAAFASYSARGYDVHVMDLDLGALGAAAAFADRFPPSAPDPAPLVGTDRTYRPLTHMRPRSWAPYITNASGERRYGTVTEGADPLGRHFYRLDVHLGSESERVGFEGFYQYDRFIQTLQLTLKDGTNPQNEGRVRRRELTLRASVPLRTVRASHELSVAWRRRRETPEGTSRFAFLDLGGLEANWTWDTAKQSAKPYPYSVWPTDGFRLWLAVLKEDPAFGSDLSLVKVTADLRSYLRAFGETDTLALRAGGGATWGRPDFKRSFAVGGVSDGSLLDLESTNHSVLRGYPDGAFEGRRFVHANAEYRISLAHPQRGYQTLPLFLRHVHAAVFVDAAHAWSGGFRLQDVKTSAGIALGADVYRGHVLPRTLTLGVARGFAERGRTHVYFRVGLAF